MKVTKTALPEEDDIVIEKRGGGKSPTLKGEVVCCIHSGQDLMNVVCVLGNGNGNNTSETRDVAGFSEGEDCTTVIRS